MARRKRTAAGGRRDFRLEVPKFATMALAHVLVDRAQPILSAAEQFRRFTVDASQLALISPVGLTTLTTIVLFARHHNLYERGTLVYPRKQHVRTYLSRMNFNRLLQVDHPDLTYRGPRRARFRELSQVETDDDCTI